jgi:hypothetical protein
MAPSASTMRRLLMLAALTSACGGGDLTLPNEGEPAEVEVNAGDLRTAPSVSRWEIRSWSW